MHHTDKYSEHGSIVCRVCANGWVFVYKLSGSEFESSCSHKNFNFAPASSKEFHDIDATAKCGFTLKCLHDMTRKYSQMPRTDKYSKHSSVIWPVCANGWVFFSKLSGSEFEFSCSHFIFRFCSCFKQVVIWHWGNYRAWIHPETPLQNTKNIQTNSPHR